MDFEHTDDRKMLVNTLDRYLRDNYAFEVRDRIARSEPGWSADIWSGLAELGIIGAMFSEADGGFGGDAFDIAAIFEQFGRALVVEPFLPTLMAGRALSRAGGHEELLENVIAGSAIVTFAHGEPQSRYTLAAVEARAEKAGGGWTITGRKAVVPFIDAADHVVVSARIEGSPGDEAGIGLFLVNKGAAGMATRGYPLIDGGHAGELALNATPASLLAADGYPVIEEVVAAGIAALAWEAVGTMDVIRDHTLEYLRTRHQFGIPIGKFQALQHRMATVALEIEQARSAAINVAAALDGDRLTRERAAAAAKHSIGRIGTIVAEEAIQMHGGIGMTWELPLSHYAKRLTMIDHQLGDEDHHLERYIALSA